VDGSTSYDFKGLTNGTTYYFAVTAANEKGESVRSNEVSAVPLSEEPQAPAIKSAEPGNGQVKITWDKVPGVEGYRIYTGTQPDFDLSQAAYVETDSQTDNYVVTGLSNDMAYYFAVTAFNENGESIKSDEVKGTPVKPVPEAPVIKSAAGDDGAVYLYWNRVQYADSYKVYAGTESGFTPSEDNCVTSTKNSCEVSGLTNGKTYYLLSRQSITQEAVIYRVN
jgi:Fibronectin type III domain.